MKKHLNKLMLDKVFEENVAYIICWEIQWIYFLFTKIYLSVTTFNSLQVASSICYG